MVVVMAKTYHGSKRTACSDIGHTVVQNQTGEGIPVQMDWNDLKVFLALERGGSARAASAQLGSSHSTVLRRLQVLEHALGVQLFDRTPEGLILTEPGIRLLHKAEQIEADVLEAERDVRGADIQLQGSIRLTAPPAVLQFVLMPYLAEFRSTYPAIDLDIVASNQFADLDRRDADVAIRFSADPGEHLVGRRLPAFRDAVYATPAYVAAHFPAGSPTTAQWIGWVDKTRFAARISASGLKDQPVAWRLPGMALQAEAARQNHGMVLLPCIMGDADDQLVRVPGTATVSNLPAWMLTHPGLRRMERVRVFARMMTTRLEEERERLAGDPDLNSDG